MKPVVRLIWNGYKYFPYERELAKREIKSLIGVTPTEIDGGIEIPTFDVESDYKILRRLTYFRQIEFSDGSRLIPDQARLEESNNIGIGHYQSIPHTRQSTRYSAHGLHEYRGKFNPQVVRSIGNILNLPIGAWILDPFCGSGTTLLECSHIGWNSVGVDLNPLGVLISNSKILALQTLSQQLQAAVGCLSESLRRAIAQHDCEKEWSPEEAEHVAGIRWAERLPNLEYLKTWFATPVLAQFAAILRNIDICVQEPIRPIFHVILSDIVRNASYQDPRDLRIRRIKNPSPNHPVISLFLSTLERRLENIYCAKRVIRHSDFYQKAFTGDSRLNLQWIYEECPITEGIKFDAAITSPPYATALPYIDTQRLSLCLLGLINSKEIMPLDRHLIGTREIMDSNRVALEAAIKNDRGDFLNQSVLKLCRQMQDTISPTDGFRRRNMPALIYGYFCDMAKVLLNVRAILKPSGMFALIVGRNVTTLGGEPILIDTPQLIADIAYSNGWVISEIVELNTYQRFDIHRRNSIKTESLVLLKKPI